MISGRRVALQKSRRNVFWVFFAELLETSTAFLYLMHRQKEQFAKVDRGVIRRLGELTKREIQVFAFLKMSRNDKTGQCNPSRTGIAAGTGLDAPHVSVAVAGLRQKGWITEGPAGFDFAGFITNLVITDEKPITDLVTKPAEKPDQSITKSVNEITKSVIGITKSVKTHHIDKQTRTDKKKQTPGQRPGTRSVSEQVAGIFRYWQTVFDYPRMTLTDLRRRKITERLKRYSVQDIMKAIDGCSITPHNRGDNDRGTPFDDIELICRNDTKLERFIALADARPKTKAAARLDVGKASPETINEDVEPVPVRRPPDEHPAEDDRIFEQFIAAIEPTVTPAVFSEWFAGIIFDGLDGRSLKLRLSRFSRDWITRYYPDRITVGLAALGNDYGVVWECELEQEQTKRAA